MTLHPVVFRSFGLSRCYSLALRAFVGGVAVWLASVALPARAVTLWSDSGATLVHDTGAGRDILEGAVKRDDSSRDTLYFKFHVNPLSDATTEEYFAAFELYEGDAERLASAMS